MPNSKPHRPPQPPVGAGTLTLDRRHFVKLVGTAAAAALARPWPAVAGPFEAADFDRLVPADKKLHPDWTRALFERGGRTVYRWPESQLIGMPVGGLCTGQLYLGGDGRLWHWDIFNQGVGTGDGHYAHPPAPDFPIDQGFALRVTAAGKSTVRRLDHTGWSEVSFTGEYPIGLVEYHDPGSGVGVSLEAFSPFVPLNLEDSALPATVMRFTVKNEGAAAIDAELAGWLENAVCRHSAQGIAVQRRNRVVRRNPAAGDLHPATAGFTFMECRAEPRPETRRTAARDDIVFDDFEGGTYANWTTTGAAFGDGPIEKDKMPAYQGDVGAHGKRLVNSHATAPGSSVAEKDAATGTLTSPNFTIQRDYITFLIGGGAHKGKTCVNLLVDDRVVLSATGKNDNRMQPHSFDVRPWSGKAARLQVVDNEKGPWGNIGIDDIVFSDEPRGTDARLGEQPDFGTMGILLLNETGRAGLRKSQTSPGRSRGRMEPGLPEVGSDAACAAWPGPFELENAFANDAEAASAMPPSGQKLVGSLSRKLSLAPGASATVTFVITWHFPNVKLAGLGSYQGRRYGKTFPDALAVADYVARHFDRLVSQTRLWHDTWYDSTLPWWFLDRTFLNTSILATNTCYWLGNGRFYAWEGVGCCAGTCTHVWHYAHAPGRLFPPLERSLRERIDYGVAFDPGTGRIRFRAEHNNHWAVDGQSGVLLRTYREHQMSASDIFLRRVWARAKKALEFLIRQDAGPDGIIDGPQHNTLDADWWGQIAWLSGLYLAALRAGEEMAREVGDDAFARRCRQIFEQGRRGLDERLFNGEYFFQLADPGHTRTVGSYDGCEIDQVFGQSWAWQVGLGRVLDETKVKTALRSLWRYNFTPDVGLYRKVYQPGRWYAMAGEGGLLMCTWPRGEAHRVKASFDYYFNECMTGFEYQVAGHMIWEGMVTEGLAITRMIHDRYHAARRNPWNEVECGDHYARAMASYGVFLAACGYEHHGPRRHLGFAPRLAPENFRCAFTTTEAWGTFSQQSGSSKLTAQVMVKWGRLHLKTLSLALPNGLKPMAVRATLSGRQTGTTLAVQNGQATLKFASNLRLGPGQHLQVELG